MNTNLNLLCFLVLFFIILSQSSEAVVSSRLLTRCSPGGLCPISISRVPNAVFETCSQQLYGYGDTFEAASCDQQVVAGIMWYCYYGSKYTQNKDMSFTCQVFENLPVNGGKFQFKSLTNDCLLGGACPVEISSEVTDLASWAINEINTQSNANIKTTELALKGVILAEEQVVTGINYYLTLDVTRGNCLELYQVAIFEALNQELTLTSYENLDAPSKCN